MLFALFRGINCGFWSRVKDRTPKFLLIKLSFRVAREEMKTLSSCVDDFESFRGQTKLEPRPVLVSFSDLIQIFRRASTPPKYGRAFILLGGEGHFV